MPTFKAPWQHWQAVEKFRQAGYDEYDISKRAHAKQRTGRTARTKLKTRQWEFDFFEAAEEQAPEEPITGRVGLEILFMLNGKTPPRHDLSNAVKSLEDALNRRAYHDDRQIDYLSALRVYEPELEDRIIARVYGI